MAEHSTEIFRLYWLVFSYRCNYIILPELYCKVSGFKLCVFAWLLFLKNRMFFHNKAACKLSSTVLTQCACITQYSYFDLLMIEILQRAFGSF